MDLPYDRQISRSTNTSTALKLQIKTCENKNMIFSISLETEYMKTNICLLIYKCEDDIEYILPFPSNKYFDNDKLSPSLAACLYSDCNFRRGH